MFWFKNCIEAFLIPVCEATMEELHEMVSNIDPDLRVDVGNYRIDSAGNFERKTIPIFQSETHLSEIVETVCQKMDDYVKARRKSNGQLTVMKLVVDGTMNPESSQVDFVQDDDLNKSLKYYVRLQVISSIFASFCAYICYKESNNSMLQCEGLLEDHEDDIIQHYVKNSTDIDIRICSLEAKLCSKTLPDPNDDYVHEEL